MAAFRQKVTTCSWVTMLTAGSSPSRQYVCCSRTRSSIQRTSSCCETTTSVPASTASTDFTMNVCPHFAVIFSTDSHRMFRLFFFLDFCHAMLCISEAYAVSIHLFVCLSVVYSGETNKQISSFFHRRVATPS